MCIILDVNLAHEVLRTSSTEPYHPLRQWLEGGSGKLILGGELVEELGVNSEVKNKIFGLYRAGIAVFLAPDDSQKVREKTRELRLARVCSSNDEHIIALAQLTGARLLCTNDKNLKSDFKNSTFISKPQGKIYPVDANPTVQRKFLNRFEGCGQSC